MEFTEQEMQKLKRICKSKKVITVRGINSYGEKFETQGYICFGPFGNSIRPNSFEITSVNVDKNISDFIMSFSNVPEDYYTNINYGCQMFMTEIYDNKNNKIYENADKKEIYKSLKKYNIKNNFDNIVNGTHPEINVLDPVSLRLTTMIGKPIILRDTSSIYDRKGFLQKIDKIDEKNNSIVVWFSTSGTLSCHYVNQETILKTINLNGKIVELEDNNKYDLTELFNERKKILEKAKNDNKNIEENDDDWWQEK